MYRYGFVTLCYRVLQDSKERSESIIHPFTVDPIVSFYYRRGLAPSQNCFCSFGMMRSDAARHSKGRVTRCIAAKYRKNLPDAAKWCHSGSEYTPPRLVSAIRSPVKEYFNVGCHSGTAQHGPALTQNGRRESELQVSLQDAVLGGADEELTAAAFGYHAHAAVVAFDLEIVKQYFSH